MYALRIVITTLDTILMWLMVTFMIGKNKETVIGFVVIISLLAANVFLIWR